MTIDVKPLIAERSGKIINSPYRKELELFFKYCDRLLEKERKIFWIDKENYLTIEQLLDYFLRNQKFETEELSLEKNILLIGNVGSGKTMIMEALSKFITGPNRFRYSECNLVAEQWNNRPPVLRSTLKLRCNGEGGLNHFYMDDLGEEELQPNYGTFVEPMEKVINFRNKLWLKYNVKTHWSTNLSMDEIDERYGERAKSRLLQTSNVLYLGKSQDSLDRRTLWKR